MLRFHSLVLSLILVLLTTIPLSAMDFYVGDFDPAPDDSEEAVELAGHTFKVIGELIDEVTCVYTDDDGFEILRITPFPMELVALMTQANIFDSLARSDEEIAPHVDAANVNKPGPNFFHFVIDGDAVWANRFVSVWYIPEIGGTEGIMIPVYPVGQSGIGPDGYVVNEFILVADTPEELQAFLFAASVKLIIEDEDPSIEPLIFDIGYWRSFGLFDLRTEQSQDEVEEVTEES